ncbi:cupin domain-containing protein [Kitasatospora sp. NPDC047058]|uniref:cupin domain-containing protein n=1 Tax=Kitasatospora sp. NPDC047058 TaxID=3155620 RepID=UPI003403F7E1
MEHLQVPALSFGTYSIPAGAVDGQSPHTEDEIYVVTQGRGSFTSGGRTITVGPGSTLFIPGRGSTASTTSPKTWWHWSSSPPPTAERRTTDTPARRAPTSPPDRASPNRSTNHRRLRSRRRLSARLRQLMSGDSHATATEAAPPRQVPSVAPAALGYASSP